MSRVCSIAVSLLQSSSGTKLPFLCLEESRPASEAASHEGWLADWREAEADYCFAGAVPVACASPKSLCGLSYFVLPVIPSATGGEVTGRLASDVRDSDIGSASPALSCVLTGCLIVFWMVGNGLGMEMPKPLPATVWPGTCSLSRSYWLACPPSPSLIA